MPEAGDWATEWGLRYESPHGRHVVNYGADRAEAQRIHAVERVAPGCCRYLVTRKVFVGKWTATGQAVRFDDKGRRTA